MAKSFDFNKFERKLFNVTLKDGRTLFVKMPPKNTFEKISEKTTLEDSDKICAELLSNNTKREEITAQFINENYDLEEKLVFLNAYMLFVTEALDSPN